MSKNFELLHTILEKGGCHTVKSNKQKQAIAVAEIKAGKKKPQNKKRIKESDLTYSELDMLVESGMRETLKNIVTESVIDESMKNKSFNLLENTKFSDDDTYSFINETIDPILETVGSMKGDKLFRKNNKVKGVNIAVYEVAMTLESARMGGLTKESIKNVSLVESPDPMIDEVIDTANSTVDTVDPNQKDDILDVVDKTVDPVTLNTVNPEDVDKLSVDSVSGTAELNKDMVEAITESTYNFRALKELTQDELMDVTQFEDNSKDMPTLDSPGELDQNYRHADEPNFKSDKSIEPVEGETAGDPNNGLFEPAMVKESKGAKLAKLMFGILEGVDEKQTSDVVVNPTSDKNLETFVGEPAGEPGPGADKPGEFEGGPSAADAIVESQIIYAKHILNSIFKEYGIKDKDAKKTIVREAVRALFKYGIDGIYPSTSDVAHIVTEQNKLSEMYDGKIINSKSVVNNTKVKFTESQSKHIFNKSIHLLEALTYANELISKKQLKEAAKIRKSVAYITKTAEVERNRQLFRNRMNNFNENAKQKLISNWVIVESFKNPTIANETKKDITVRNYIVESNMLKDYFVNVLKENSPIFNVSLKKKVLNNDALTTATIMTEAAIAWTKIKKNYYNNKPKNIKMLALESMINIIPSYVTLAGALKNQKALRTVLESFSYRLQSLHDKLKLVK